MNKDDEYTSLLEELLAIRRSLSSACPKENLPLLDDVVTHVDSVQSSIAPILSDAISQPSPQTRHQAKKSWQRFWQKLNRWADTLPAEEKLIAQKVLDALRQQLANAWESAYEQIFDSTQADCQKQEIEK